MKAWRLVAILLLGLTLWPIAPAHAQGPAQVWVDDDFTASSNNEGHRWQVDAFPTISAAVSAVAPGGVVNVLSGNYREDIRISRSCQVIHSGEGAAVLTPRYADVTLTVAANDVTIQGLEVAGAKQAAILIQGPNFQREPIRNVIIRENVIHGGQFGVAVNIDAAWTYGQIQATGIEIAGNTITGCTRALYIYNTQAQISGNNVSQLSPEGIGIFSSQGSTANIKGNTVTVDVLNGRGLYILDNQSTIVDSNVLTGTTDVMTPTTALALYGYTDLALTNNTIHGFYWGTNAYTGGSAHIAQNEFEDTVAWAMNFGSTITSTQVTVDNNIIRGSYWGLRLDDSGGYGVQAKVQGNSFYDNVIGVQLGAAMRTDQASIHGNAFCDSLIAGLRNEAEEPADATDNWWGASDGPAPSGSGDRVEGTGGIKTTPWLRLTTSTRTLPGGGVVIKVKLGNDRFGLHDQAITFTADEGKFAESDSSERVVLTDWQGEAQATLAPLLGETAIVAISTGCGQKVTVRVR